MRRAPPPQPSSFGPPVPWLARCSGKAARRPRSRSRGRGPGCPLEILGTRGRAWSLRHDELRVALDPRDDDIEAIFDAEVRAAPIRAAGDRKIGRRHRFRRNDTGCVRDGRIIDVLAHTRGQPLWLVVDCRVALVFYAQLENEGVLRVETEDLFNRHLK